MVKVIKERIDLCVGCNRCVRECPMEMANITYRDASGAVKSEIDFNMCINCGRCVSACKHNARYFTDDTARFFADLSEGKPISLIAAPSVRTNIPEYKKLFTYLKKLGVNKIYDVSLGADICVWAHIKHLEKNPGAHIITQSCPAIVTYCETYRHDLLGRLSPVHSPMACISVYIKEYQGLSDSIAALSPCMAKSLEFNETKLADYNVTFTKLLEYLKENGVVLPDEESDFDHAESGLGSLFPMPGGFKESIEYFIGKRLHITGAEGEGVYEKLDMYAQTAEDFLPDIYDVLSCADGCNIGTAASSGRCVFVIDKTMNDSRMKAEEDTKRKYYESVYKAYDNSFELRHFLRQYKAIPATVPQVTDADIERVFRQMGKDTFDKQHVDCFACGSKTCYDMARKIALNVNIPNNCIFKVMEDSKEETEQNMRAHAQIAEMKRAHEEDERMRIMLDSMPLAAHFWDENLNMTDCNEAAAKMFNLSKQDYVKRYFEFMPEFQPDGVRSDIRVRDVIQKTFKEGTQRIELMCLSLDGEEVPIDDTYVRVNHKDATIVAGFSVDLREHKRILRELENLNTGNEFQLAKLNMMIKTAHIGLWEMALADEESWLNPNNHIVWSDEFRHIMGFEGEHDFPNVLSMWSSRLHPDDAEKTANAIVSHWSDKTGGTPYDAEFRIMKKNGEYAYISASSTTVRDEDGNPVRSAGTLIDMTQLKNLMDETESRRAEADTANKAKSEFLSHISHEIRTPMNAVIGTAEIQLQKETNSPEIEEAFNTIYNSGNLLLNIINDILDLSKIEAGKLELVPAPYDIPSIIYDTVQLNLLRYESKPINFELKIDGNTPLDLHGDELRIKQVLNNILSNAFKYTDQGEVELSVSAEELEDDMVMLVLRVKDTGQGMTEEQIGKLFEEYVRFNMDVNRTIVGTGLGMHITKRLVDTMEGEISVESELNKGTVFTVRLPQKRIGDIVCGEELAEKLRSSRFKSMLKLNRAQIVHEYMPYGCVLIVDDVESNLYVAKGMMLPYGLKLETVTSGFGAIEKIKNGMEYDIIFMDHMMPKMNGVEATRIIRDMGYNQPVVALTANAIAGSSDMFMKNGFDGYISKPIDIRELNAVLNRFIRDKQPPEVIEAVRREFKESKSTAFAKDDELAVAVVLDIKNALPVLTDTLNDIKSGSKDTELFTTTVHGMKSALANIGESELSGIALSLEKAGSNTDIGFISSETPAFISALEALTEKYKREDAGNPEEIHDDMDLLREKLSLLAEACEGCNKRAAKAALDELRRRKWTKDTTDTLNEIAICLLRGEFAKAVALTKKYQI